MSASRSAGALEIAPLRRNHVYALETFFSALLAAGDDAAFHPHPFSRREAKARCSYTGLDLYYVLGSVDQIVAYGMLRGWDEGFEVPSLGLAVSPQMRGRGFGRLLLGFLHVAAAWRGAESVRLKVYRDNERARRLYASAGYTFVDGPADYLVGTRRLRR